MTRLELASIMFESSEIKPHYCPYSVASCSKCKYIKDKPNCSEAFWNEEISPVTISDFKKKLKKFMEEVKNA